MGAFSVAAAAVVAIHFPHKSPLQSQRGAISITTRTRICFSRRLLFFTMKSDESSVDGLHNLRVVPSATLTARKEATVVPEAVFTVEKEAVKNVLTLFLRKQGLTNAAASRTISKSDRFINHLISRLQIIDKTRYLVGSELPILALEIRDVLVPYLESLLAEHGDILVDVVENFPNPPDNKGPIFQASPTKFPLDSKKLEVMGPSSELQYSGKHTLYLLDIGLDLEQINEICRRYPHFFDYSLEEMIKPVVEFLFDLGMPQSEIPTYICRANFCLGWSLSNTTIPTLLYLESLGVDKERWLRILKSCPVIFKSERRDVERTVDCLQEIGLSRKEIVEVIAAFPSILVFNVDTRLRPIAEHFHSMGVNVPCFLCRFPKVFGANPKHIAKVTDFFLEKGYSIEEIRTMAMRHGTMYLLNVEKYLIPKLDFFLTMDYPRSMLVRYPRYFNFSLEGRIKPRFEKMMGRGKKLLLSQLFSSSDTVFEMLLNRKQKPPLRRKRFDHTVG